MTGFSYQLYSSRNFPPLEDTLEMLSKLGYNNVEGFGALLEDVNPRELRTLLDKINLTMTSSHVGLDLIESDPQRVIDITKAIGIEKVYGPYLQEEDRPKNTEDWIDFAKKLKGLSQPLIDAGLGFGWHNHDFEFLRLEDGQIPIEVMLSEFTNLEIEFDVAWCVKADHDPIEFIKKHNARITAAHIKDIAAAGECADEDGWADVGYGIVDWPTIYDALKASGTKLFIMEHDNPNDHNRFASRSLASAKSF
ncbi:sugar phosphate isomerase/epimerase family protein [Lentilitoribacter sp. EG35]|uniref:sugar phosphate isomerase/epimerase family protein n=1 Tax=Lentilitoribacter sp. EG35 TaxID=3234192 RepID=UPI00345F4AC2